MSSDKHKFCFLWVFQRVCLSCWQPMTRHETYLHKQHLFPTWKGQDNCSVSSTETHLPPYVFEYHYKLQWTRRWGTKWMNMKNTYMLWISGDWSMHPSAWDKTLWCNYDFRIIVLWQTWQLKVDDNRKCNETFANHSWNYWHYHRCSDKMWKNTGQISAVSKLRR